MHRASLLLFLIVLVSLTACARLLDAGRQPLVETKTPPMEGTPPGLDGDTPVSDQTPLPPSQTPAVEQPNLVEGEVFIRSTELLVMESYPLQVALIVKGELPTPCHRLKAEVKDPDELNRIQVSLVSLVDPTEICIQMLQAFEERISLGSYPDGSYTVYLNGKEVGKFTQ